MLKEEKQYYELNVPEFSEFLYGLRVRSEDLSEPNTIYNNDGEEIVINFDIERKEKEKIQKQMVLCENIEQHLKELKERNRAKYTYTKRKEGS